MRWCCCLAWVTLIATVVCAAAPSAASLLRCSPNDVVEQNFNVTCTIWARDVYDEPLSTAQPTDFQIIVSSDNPDARVRVTSPARTVDPTALAFTASANTGTKLRIDVTTADGGDALQGSGAMIVVLVWPPTSVGAIVCTPSTVTLRDFTTCSAPLTGDGGRPAAAHRDDVFLSEDHAAGTFELTAVKGALGFRFSAPATLLSAVSSFSLRVSLGGIPATFGVVVPLVYPPLPATTRSVLKCTDGAIAECVVTAADAVGAVAYDPQRFGIVVETATEGTEGTWSPTSDVNVTTFPWTTGATRLLRLAPRMDVRVFTCRLRVTVEGEDVINSPTIIPLGTAPTARSVIFSECTASFVAAGQPTFCTLTVVGASADPSYVVLGSVAGGTFGPIFATVSAGGGKTMTFNYTAPNVGARTEDAIVATIGGETIRRAPYHLIVFPATNTPATAEGGSGDRPTIIGLGVAFFAIIVVVTMVLVWLRSRRLARIKKVKMIHVLSSEGIRPTGMSIPSRAAPSPPPAAHAAPQTS